MIEYWYLLECMLCGINKKKKKNNQNAIHEC